MWQMYNETSKQIEAGQFGSLQELHILSCIMKVLCTNDACEGIERLRMSCGGHGYLTATNIGNIYGNAVAAITYEGENTVLLLQIGRFLMKQCKLLQEGKKLVPSMQYLVQAKEMQKFPKWNNSWECIVQALQYAAACKTQVAFKNFSKRLLEGQSQGEAINNTGIELIQAAEVIIPPSIFNIYIYSIF